MAAHMSTFVLINLESVAWWFYSSCLGVFFVALPFSRYMHIFTEIPLIFLRHYKLRSTEKEGSFDNFQVEACSRCGICIDPCQLQSVLGIDNVQSVYFLRDRRYKMLRLQVADNCLMCGRCAEKCPVDIDLNTLRLNSRDTMRNVPDEKRYGYFKGLDRSSGEEGGLFRRVHDPPDAPYDVGDGKSIPGRRRRGLVGRPRRGRLLRTPVETGR